MRRTWCRGWFQCVSTRPFGGMSCPYLGHPGGAAAHPTRRSGGTGSGPPVSHSEQIEVCVCVWLARRGEGTAKLASRARVPTYPVLILLLQVQGLHEACADLLLHVLHSSKPATAALPVRVGVVSVVGRGGRRRCVCVCARGLLAPCPTCCESRRFVELRVT